MKIEYQDALRISAMLDVLIDEMKTKRGEKVSRLKERIEEKLKICLTFYTHLLV